MCAASTRAFSRRDRCGEPGRHRVGSYLSGVSTSRAVSASPRTRIERTVLLLEDSRASEPARLCRAPAVGHHPVSAASKALSRSTRFPTPAGASTRAESSSRTALLLTPVYALSVRSAAHRAWLGPDPRRAVRLSRPVRTRATRHGDRPRRWHPKEARRRSGHVAAAPCFSLRLRRKAGTTTRSVQSDPERLVADGYGDERARGQHQSAGAGALQLRLPEPTSRGFVDADTTGDAARTRAARPRRTGRRPSPGDREAGSNLPQLKRISAPRPWGTGSQRQVGPVPTQVVTGASLLQAHRHMTSGPPPASRSARLP